MGIRSLNKFLQNKCKNLFPEGLEGLRGKTIAIDAHNYLYQIINGDLLKNVTDACYVFKKYNIKTIWVFDGYPPEYKKKIIKQRKNYFNTLHSKHTILMQIKKDGITSNLNKSIDILEKKMRKLTSNDIAQVKKYLENNNYDYFVTNNGIEADTVCVDLVKSNSAYAVLSEDMDIIGMGCPMTIRKFNKIDETCIYYDIDNIIDELCITTDKFKKMCKMVTKNVTIGKAFELIK
jgi:flap endonuclease-1